MTGGAALPAARAGARTKDAGPELYDLIDDPFEKDNLYGKLPKVVESLRSKLESWYRVKERTVAE